jgi:hypothetical protein
MAIMGGAVARESLAVRAWAATCVYVTIYGVAFLFLAGPATQALAALGDPGAHRFVVFILWLVTAVVLTVGAALRSYTLDFMLDRRLQHTTMANWRIETAYALRGIIFALLAAGLFLGIGAVAVGGVSAPLLWAALWAFIVPGFAAGVLTHSVLPAVVSEKKQLVTVSGVALAVVVLSNYVLVGAVEPLSYAAGA